MVSNEEIQETAKTANGWVDTLKERIQFDKMADKAWASKNIIIDVLLYGGIGFLIGFLFKKHSQYLIFFILFFAGCFVLKQFDIMSITFNWPRIHELMGTQPTGMVGDNLLLLGWEWIKANLAISLSFIIGFLAGLKVG